MSVCYSRGSGNLNFKLRRSGKMGEKEIFEKMVNILKPYTKNMELLEKATEDTHILDDLQVNSARLVDVIIACEDVFDIEIDDDEADEIRTIGDAVKVISNKLA